MKPLLRHAGQAAAGIAVLVVLVVAVGEATGWPWLRGPLQDAASRAAGVPVTLAGRFRLKLLGRPVLQAEQLSVGAGGGLALPHLASGRGVVLAWRWGEVWRWWREDAPLQLRSLSADALDLRLVRDAQGHASWQLGRRDAPRRDDAALPRVGTLTVRDGHIVVDDAPLATQLDVRVAGSEGRGGNAPAGYRIEATGRWRAQPVSLQAHTGGVLPLLLDPGESDRAPVLSVELNGTVGDVKLAFDGRAAALFGEPRIDGRLHMAAPSLASLGRIPGVALPQTPPFELGTQLSHQAGRWTLNALQAAIGRSRLAGELTYDANRTPPLLAGRLAGPRLALADLGPAIGAPPKGTGRAAKKGAAGAPPGRVLPQRRFDLPKLQAMDADVQFAVDELDFGTGALAALKHVATHIRLERGVLQLQDLKADTAGGHVAGSSRLDSGADPARWGAKLVFSRIDVDAWIRGLRTKPRDGKGPTAYLTGSLNADLDVAGAGRSTAEILATLDGRAVVTLRKGTISHLVTEGAGLDIAQALGVAVRGDRPLPLRCAKLDLDVKNGLVTPRTAVIDNADSTLHIGGRLNLADESLALVLRARPKDFSPLSLRSPITVTGSLGAPHIGIEGGPAAGRVLGAVVLGALVGPVAALLPLVDAGSGDAKDVCAAP